MNRLGNFILHKENAVCSIHNTLKIREYYYDETISCSHDYCYLPYCTKHYTFKYYCKLCNG